MPFINVKGLDFYYELTDFRIPWQKRDQTLIFLHGLHGSIKYWNHYQVAFFSRYFNVLTIDQRGHGKSYKPSSGYIIENMADDIHEIMKALQIDHANLVGASMGGVVSLQMALAFPSAVKSLVMVDSFPNSPAPLTGVIQSWIDAVEKKGYEKLMETFNQDNPGLFSKQYLKNRPNFIEYDDREVLNNLMPAEAFIGCCRAIQNYDASNRLGEIKQPSLLITSNEGLGYDSAMMMKAKMANASLWTPQGVGHLVNIEIPDDFNQHLLEFLQSIK